MSTPTRIQFRRGTAAAWALANPTLSAGEPGYETDTGKLKLGDGTTTWVALPYGAGVGPGGEPVADLDFADDAAALAGESEVLIMSPATTRTVRDNLTTTWGVLPTNYVLTDGTWAPRSVPSGYTGPVTFDSATVDNASNPPAVNGDRWLRRKPS